MLVCLAVLLFITVAFITESTIGTVQCTALVVTGQTIVQQISETSAVSGIANLQDAEAGLQLTVDLEASPGEHGFHIYEAGSCADAGSAAGGHDNPDRVQS